MSAKILDGRIVRDSRLPDILKRIRNLPHAPTLAIIQVGDRPDSTAFINAKKSFANKLGVRVEHFHLKEKVSDEELSEAVQKCNKDARVTGIIIQLPLPEHLNREAAIDVIDAKKDADGLRSSNINKSATARGVKELLDYYNISFKNKKVTVIGNSPLVGQPIAELAKKEGAVVTVCDSQTKDLSEQTLIADIIISAVGHPNLITTRNVKKGQIVVDIGITRTSNGKLAGDVDYENVKNVVAAITPVPGGVGPMTVLALFENLLDLA